MDDFSQIVDRIILVDDNPNDVIMIKKALGRVDSTYSISSVKTGTQCLLALAEKSHDIVLLDYSLPDINGLEVLKKIRDIDTQIPVIMMTGRGDGKVPIEALNRGANYYIEKSHDYLKSISHIVKEFLEKRRLLLNLKNTEKKYKELVNRIPDIIYELDSEGKIKYISLEATRALGYETGELRGRHIRQIVCKEDFELLENELRKERRGGASLRGLQVKFISKQRQLKHFEINSKAVYDSSNNYIASEGIARDITERKRMANDLMQSEKLAAIGGLISGVAHELNNPLTGILFYSEGLLDANHVDTSVKDDLIKIHRESKRCARIVQDLLMFSRSHKFEKVPVLLNDLLMEAIDSLDYQFTQNNITVEMDLDPKMQKTMGDAHQLRQVFHNIINNAIHSLSKSGKSGKIIITTEQSNDVLHIQFLDTGQGIEQKYIKNIFEPFFSTKEPGKGTGLGLSLSYGIVKDHDGTIDVENVVGGGALFKIAIPAKNVSGVISPQVRKRVLMQIPSKRFLLVDRQEEIRVSISSLLSKNNHRTDLACDGKTALTFLRSSQYDLLLVDVDLSDISGFNLIEEILNVYPAYTNKIVLLVSKIDDETELFALNTGCFFIQKPFGSNEIEDILLELFPEEVGISVSGDQRVLTDEFRPHEEITPNSSIEKSGFQRIRPMVWKKERS